MENYQAGQDDSQETAVRGKEAPSLDAGRAEAEAQAEAARAEKKRLAKERAEVRRKARQEAGEPEGRKATVYLRPAWVAWLGDNPSFTVGDVLERGFASVPINKDGTVPKEYRLAMEHLSRTAAILANGGHVFTDHATLEVIEKALGVGISDREAAGSG